MILINSCKEINDDIYSQTFNGKGKLAIVNASLHEIDTASVVAEGIIIDDGDCYIKEVGFIWSMLGSNISSEKTISIDTLRSAYSMRISGLSPGKFYIIKPYVINNKGISYGAQLKFITNKGNNQILDYDKNIYTPIRIGKQIWLKENLKVTHYRDGQDIGIYTDYRSSDDAFCWYDNDSLNKHIYGALYTSFVFKSDKFVCPAGWRVPAEDDWTVLEEYLGGITISGPKLMDTIIWDTNIGDNSSNFSAVPSGYRITWGDFVYKGITETWWTSEEKIVELNNSGQISHIYQFGSLSCNSIRCIKDSLMTPIVKFSAILEITESSAIFQGTVLSYGNEVLTARGVCWSTSQNPTINDNISTAGVGLGNFNCFINNLLPFTNYYARLYATNIYGTSYSSSVSFKTLAKSLNVLTNTPLNITSSSAILGGSVESPEGIPVSERGIYWGVYPNPEISGTKLQIGDGTGSFNTNVTGLNINTKYYYRAYAINNTGMNFGDMMYFTTDPLSIHDNDNNSYNVIRIGNQLWMKENLKTTKYQNGDQIPNVSSNSLWGTQFTGAYCWYDNDNGNKNIYGALYNYYAIVDSRNICPLGWHIPSYDDWVELSDYLGGSDLAGGTLKSTDLWLDPNIGASNSSNFTALPSGYRQSYEGYFFSKGSLGIWWSTTKDWDETLGLVRKIQNSGPEFWVGTADFRDGLSVRCIRDN